VVLTHPCSHTFPDNDQSETVREGYEPDEHQPHGDEQNHNLDHPFRVGDGDDDLDGDAETWQERDYNGEDGEDGEDGDKGNDGGGDRKKSPSYGSFREERDIWGSRDS
jgi:hypothetical protein